MNGKREGVRHTTELADSRRRSGQLDARLREPRPAGGQREPSPLALTVRPGPSHACYDLFVLDEVRRLLEADDRVAYALLFGSAARGAAHSGSDLDIGLGLKRGLRLGVLELGELVSRLEGAAGRQVDLVLLEEAPPGIAYRAFREGQLIFERDRSALVERKARAILEYLDYRPIEELCAQGVLAAASRG